MNARSQAGATLIELVLAIVIVSAAASTIVGLLTMMARQSADMMVQSQSASIANAYLNEILVRTLGNPANPDGQDATCTTAESIDDYPGCLPAGNLVRDRAGNLIASFADYRVVVTVTQPGFPNPFGVIPTNQTRLVRVSVTSPFGDTTTISGFKTRH